MSMKKAEKSVTEFRAENINFKPKKWSIPFALSVQEGYSSEAETFETGRMPPPACCTPSCHAVCEDY